MSRVKSCSKCEAPFDCCPEGNCWCNDAHIDQDLLRKLWVTYDNCLCPKCLSEFANNPEEVKKYIKN